MVAALALALALLLHAPPSADAKKKAKRSRAPQVPDVSVEFTEPGPLGLDFSLEKLPGGKVGLAIKGVAEGSHAAQFPQIKPGMRLLSVDDETGGVVVKTEIKSSSPQELSKLAKTAMGETRPITAHFANAPVKKVLKGDATALIKEGTRLGQEGRIPEALAAMERAVTLRPDMAEAQYNLGIGYDRGGRSPEAVAAFQTAMKLKPTLPKPMSLTLWETAQAQAAAAAEQGGEGDAAAEQLCEADLVAAHRLSETHRVAPVLSEREALQMIDSVQGGGEHSSRENEEIIFTHPIFTYYDTDNNPTGQPAILETSSVCVLPLQAACSCLSVPHECSAFPAGSFRSARCSPADIVSHGRYKRTSLEIARDIYSATYDKISAAVAAANTEIWNFDGLVSSSMIQHMVAYDAGGADNASLFAMPF